jgi:hypothetical protein
MFLKMVRNAILHDFLVFHFFTRFQWKVNICASEVSFEKCMNMMDFTSVSKKC